MIGTPDIPDPWEDQESRAPPILCHCWEPFRGMYFLNQKRGLGFRVRKIGFRVEGQGFGVT